MKKLFCGALAALMTLSLAGCRTAAQPEQPSPSQPASSDTPVISAGPEVSELDRLPAYVSDFRFDMIRAYGGENNRDRSTAYALTGEQTTRLREALTPGEWTTAAFLSAVDYETPYLISDGDGNKLLLAVWDAESCLVTCFDASGKISNMRRYFAPIGALDSIAGILSGEVPLGVIEPETEEYYDLFRPDAGLPPLIELMEDGGDGSFSDDQMAAYAIQTLGSQGLYDDEAGVSGEALDAVTAKHFGRTVQNYDNSVTYVLDNGNVTATGWSFDSSVYLVLDGQSAAQDGIITARFKCYNLSDSLWMDGEIDQQKLNHAREYLLTGNDGDFPAPELVEITFAPSSEDDWQSQYVFYESMKYAQ
jgi:hypothetical protein